MTAHHHAEDYVPFMKEVDAPVLKKPFSAEDLNAGLPQVDDAAPR